MYVNNIVKIIVFIVFFQSYIFMSGDNLVVWYILVTAYNAKMC